MQGQLQTFFIRDAGPDFPQLRCRSNSMLCILNIVMGIRRAPQPLVALAQVVVFLVYIFVQGVVYMHCKPLVNFEDSVHTLI